MKNTDETQTTTEQSWRERALKAEARVDLLSKELEFLNAHLHLLKAKRFGPSSEKTNPDQLRLFEAAIAFSIVETAKENGLKPFDYIEYLLSSLPNTDLTHLDPFMPWSENLPERCRTPKKKQR